MTQQSTNRPADVASASKILLDEGESAASRYRALMVGDRSFLFFLFYEMATFFVSGMPGALGLWLRRKLITPFLGGCGSGVVIGKQCTIRHPHRLFLGDNVVIDDFCVIDARGATEDGVKIGSKTIINRGTVIVSKGGDIHFGDECAIGNACSIVSWTGISIGNGVGMAAGCVISAGTYNIAHMSLPRNQRRAESAGPVSVGNHVWIASRVTILDGVTIGDDAVLSAGAIIRGDIPAKSVAHGNPASVVFTLRD